MQCIVEMYGQFSHINELLKAEEWRFNKMLRVYNQDVQYGTIWLTEIMGFQIEQVSIL